MLTVITLGTLEIRLNDQPLRFRMSKAAVLLVYLMRKADKPHGREQLATLLWPDKIGRTSNENLRQAIYQIRRALGDHAPTYLTVTATTVQFIAKAPHTLDANQFEQAIAQRAWLKAADLYLGEFLPTFYPGTAQELGEWQAITSEHLHHLAAQAFIELARQQETSNPRGAIQYARRLLALEPWGEPGHRLLMRCWARLGQPAQALAQYQQCAQILADELGTTPTSKTINLYEQIRDDRWQATAPPAISSPASIREQLPANLTPLIGRKDELAALRQLLAQPDCRLLTIMGVGGIGKTKLMVNLGWACHHAQQYADGVLFVSLAELEPMGDEAVANQIAHHLVRELISTTAETNITTALELLQKTWHGRRILLLLDNWEHLLEGVTLLTDLLTQLPQLTIVTTSRVPLNLYGEEIYSLHGLSVTAEKGATQLFAQAARRVQPHFSLDEATSVEAVNTLCHALEGHPLALEMAAASLRGLTLAELVAEVTTGLDVLTTNQPNIPARQRNMRHLLAASWGRLTSTEQPILAQLSLFRQPLSVAAAQAVTGARVGQMATIVAQAWLRRTAEGRYQSHELLRHFGREQLAQNPALEQAAKQKYIHYHLQWLADWAHKLLTDAMLTELTSCWADITLAWGEGIHQQMWSELEGAIPTLGAFYEHKGLLGEGIEWLAGAVKQLHTAVVKKGDLMPPAAQRVCALLLIAQADLRITQVQAAPVPALMAQAIALAEALDDGELLLLSKMNLAGGLARLGRLTEMLELCLTLLQQNTPAPSPPQQAQLWGMIGTTYADLGELTLAEQYLRQAVAYYEANEDAQRAASTRHNLAMLLLEQKAYQTARRLFLQNALFLRQHPSTPHQANVYEGLGESWMNLGRLGLAERYLQQAQKLYEKMGDEDGLAYVALHQGKIALLREEWPHAEQLFLKSAELRQKMNLPHMLTQPWVGLALAAWRRGNTAVAQNYLDKTLPIVLASEVKGEGIAWVYEVIAELAQEMGHPQAEEIVAARLSNVKNDL